MRKQPIAAKRRKVAQEKFFRALAMGATRAQAAAFACISPVTASKWLAIAKDSTDPDDIEFLSKVEEAEAVAVVRWLDQIDRAAKRGQWQAAAWKLERRYPEVFGRIRRDESMQLHEHQHRHEHKVVVKLAEKTSDNIAAVLQVMEECGLLNGKNTPELPAEIIEQENVSGEKTESAELVAVEKGD